MQVLKVILALLAIVLFPILTFQLIRLALKAGRALDHVNRTLDDARPQLLVLLANLNHALDEANHELDDVVRMTGEVEEMLRSAEEGLRAVEKALRSPWARLGGTLAAFATTSFLLRGVLRRLPGGEDG